MEKNKDEKVPLLMKNNVSLNSDVSKEGNSKWPGLLCVIGVVLLHLFSYLLNFYVMNQYSYYAHFERQYPNSSFTPTGSGSACNNTNTTQYKQQIVVQKLTSEWNIYCTLVSNIPGILFVINLASLSDVHGRKLFFIAPLVGSLLKNILCAIGIYFSLSIDLFVLFYAIEGCTGSWISTLSMVYCYIADVTEAGKPRSLVIGALEGGVGIGLLASATFSGYLIQWTNGYFYPVLTSVATLVIALILVVLFLSESLPVHKRRNKVPMLQNMTRVTECYRSNFSPYAKQWMFIILIFIFIMSAFSNIGRIQVETLVQLDTPFCWDSVRIGWYGTLKMGMLSIGGVALIKVFHCCTTDEYVALAGCVTTVASCVLLGIANTDTIMYLSAAVGIGSTISMPMVRSIMSRLTPADKQGSIFAGVAAVEIVCNMGSALGANAVYDATVAIYRGITFFVMAGYAVIGIILCLVFIIGQPDHPEHKEITVDVNDTDDTDPYVTKA